MCKKKGKTKAKKLSQVLKTRISGMLWVILLKFGMWTTEVGGHFYGKKIVSFCKGSMELCMHENYIIVLPVNDTLV